MAVAVRRQTVEVLLTLDGDEAQCLADILSNIAESRATSRRGLANRISEALEGAGVHFQSPPPDLTGRIDFEEVDAA